MDRDRPVVLFAGGGTGGHVCPALAVSECLSDMEFGPGVYFACSSRVIDSQILNDAGVVYKKLPMQVYPSNKMKLPMFGLSYLRSCRRVSRLMRRNNVKCVVSMGGFVSVPVVNVAHHRGIPVVMVNLDSVPGKANRLIGGRGARVLSVYDIELPGVLNIEGITMPLRRSAISPYDRKQAHKELGFNPNKPLLFICGGSHGAQSLNEMMVELMKNDDVVEALSGWQILHLTGVGDVGIVQDAYLNRHLDATVKSFVTKMGLTWGASDLAISRGGAGSVAEVCANAVPTMFFPYPHHSDMHQRSNAKPLVDADCAMLFDDAVVASDNADQVAEMLIELLGNEKRREGMRENLRGMSCRNGAEAVVDVVMDVLNNGRDVI